MSTGVAVPGRLLHAYGVDAPGRDAELDPIVAEAARVTRAPVAIAGFISGDREVVKGSAGWSVTEFPMASSLARRVENESDLLVAADTLADPQLRLHPLVTGNPHVRFFAGVPLRDPSGVFLGALYVIDRAPLSGAPEQMEPLRLLGRQLERELELRRERAVNQEELVRVREMLEDSDARFRDFFDSVDDFVVSMSADGRLLHSNDAVPRILGFTREEVSNIPMLQLIAPDARAAFRMVSGEVFSTGHARPVETVFVTAGGRQINAEGVLRPHLIDGVPVLGRAIFRDVTERTEYEAELGSARDAALDASRVKTQFLTNVSHEIRTPMNGIVGMVDLLLSSPLTADQQEYAHYARASAEQLLAIVNNILYVSKIEAGSLAAENVDFDLYRTLDRIVEVMKIAALGKDLDVTFKFDEHLPPVFRGSQGKIRQVITNLLENAIKFTEQGSVSLDVSMQSETESHRIVRFEVRDTGIGIAAEDLSLVFEKFSQVEASSTRRYQGVGLGLATARQLVETMGGLIDVDTTPGAGSRFWFSVPFPKDTGTARPIASSDLEFRGKRVLLVDQSTTSRRIVLNYLESTWQMRVESARTGAESLAVLRRESATGDPIRVVIFDAMPDLDALDFARAVRGEPAIARTSLVHLLATSSGANDEALRVAGVNAYLAKPVGQGELFDAMTVALAHDAISLSRPVLSAPSPAQPIKIAADRKKSVRVLLAEDNFLNRKLTMSQLEKLGYTADSVANGKEALDALEGTHYDIILMDCQMPIVDGYQATIEIRRRELKGASKHRIIAMTANALEGDREKCLAAGMDDYLSKPTKHDDLELALARFFA